MHTTNYYNAFIEAADDSHATEGTIPMLRADAETIASLQFKMVIENPYHYTSDDVIFGVYATRNNIPTSLWDEERAAFFSKGQACMRASPLTKTYGWGVHANAQGKIALYPLGSPEYDAFKKDSKLQHVMAMRAKRK